MAAAKALLFFFFIFSLAYVCLGATAGVSVATRLEVVQLNSQIGQRSSSFTFARKRAAAPNRIVSFHNDLYPSGWTPASKHGSVIGTNQGVCFETELNERYECAYSFSLPNGTVTVQGPYSWNERTTLIVTGGQGIYTRYRGSVNVTHGLTAKYLIWTFGFRELIYGTVRKRPPKVEVYQKRSSPGGSRTSSMYSFMPFGTEGQPNRITPSMNSLRWTKDSKGPAIGYNRGFCVETFFNVYMECLYTFYLPNGVLTAQGPYNFNYKLTTLVITGASGGLAKFGGSAQLTPEVPFDHLRWTFFLQQNTL